MSSVTGRRVGIFGLFAGGNLGNEATLAATLYGLSQSDHDCQVTLISQQPDAPSGLPGTARRWSHDPLPVAPLLDNFRPVRLRNTVRALLENLTHPLRRLLLRRRCRELDLLLVAGTGIADDFGQEPHQVPLHLLYWCQAASATGVPIRFVSVGAGPVASDVSRARFRAAFALAGYRSYRDAASREFVRSLGIDVSRDQVMPDLVFGLFDQVSDLAKAVHWPPRTIAIGVMAYSGWNAERTTALHNYTDYVTRLTELTHSILTRGYNVRLIVGNRVRDLATLNEIAGRVKKMQPSLCNRLYAASAHTYLDALRDIGGCDLVVATRFHSVVFGLLLGRPCISLGYATKNDALMAAFDLAEYCQTAAEFDPAWVLTCIDKMISVQPPPMASIATKSLCLASAVELQFADIVRG